MRFKIMENKINKDFKVYMHKSPSGKRYIGITCQRPVRRWGSNGYGYIDNIYFWRAIQKYGWDNFQHEILFDGLTKDEAEQKEIELIAFYNSTDPNKGYNITSGGGYSFNIVLRPVKQYTTDGIFVKEYECIQDASEETGINKGNICLCCNNERKTTGGYIWRFSDDDLTEEHLTWCNHDGHSDYWTAVCQYAKDGKFIKEYSNFTIAGLATNINPAIICLCCKGKCKFADGFIWRYANEELTQQHIDWCNNGKGEKTPVLQYSLHYELLADFDGIKSAIRLTGIDPSTIIRCCKGKQKTAGGFIWRYASEVSNFISPLLPILSETA